MKLKTEKIHELEAAEVFAAETLVTRHLKIVDDFGNVRIDATVDSDDEAGPKFRVFDQHGEALVLLSVVDGGECHGITQLWMSDQNTEGAEVFLAVGSLSGPSLDLTAPHRRGDRGTRLGLLAEHDAAFVVAHGADMEKRTMLQLVAGERLAEFIDGSENEKEASS